MPESIELNNPSSSLMEVESDASAAESDSVPELEKGRKDLLEKKGLLLIWPAKPNNPSGRRNPGNLCQRSVSNRWLHHKRKVSKENLMNLELMTRISIWSLRRQISVLEKELKDLVKTNKQK